MVSLVTQMLDLNKNVQDARLDHEKTLLQRQIEATDAVIDNLVYEPYGLTGEEIAIVEGNGKIVRKNTGALKKIVDIIARSADPDRIILFGSRSKGTQDPQRSDYDICVIKRGIKHRRELAMKLYRDLYGVGVPVDVIVETPEVFEESRDNPFLIYHDIAQQGRVIYEKPVPC